MSEPAEFLRRFANRYQWERAAARVLLGTGVGILLAGVAHWFGAGSLAVPLMAASGLALGIAAALLQQGRKPITPQTLAQHFDRALPELEESTALLIPGQSQSTISALQHARIAPRWDPARARAVLPSAGLGRALTIAIPSALVGALLLTRGGAADRSSMARRLGVPAARPALVELAVRIVPPDYTGASARTSPANDVEAEEGAGLTWRAKINDEARAVWLIVSAGDSLQFHPTGNHWEATARADRSLLARVRLLASDGSTVTSDDHRLVVKPDRPPTITIIHPDVRTVFQPGALSPVPVEILANDDYGVDSVVMSATIASGSGEAVRFRRLELPFAHRVRRPGTGLKLDATIDLASLRLGTGDELYFFVLATDGRTPVANRTKSETVFLSIRDTSQAPRAELAGMVMNVQPEWFRSQRQLIIDTERLMVDAPKLSTVTFRERSNDIGIDQGLLRLRYGEFLGEEFEESSGGAQHHDEPEPEPPSKPVEADPNRAAEATSGQATESQARKASDPFTHAHDNAENATLLGLSVKDQLRVAVAAMWQSELQLRIAQPDAALPFEYRALELIKQIQQDSRAYVQRVGFEPPPIDLAATRLTGRLSKIQSPRRQETVSRHDSLPAVRAAIVALSASRAGGPGLAAEIIEAAGRELAPEAVADPRLLPVLRDLRRLADQLSAHKPCAECLDRAERGLWSALPAAEPLAQPVPGASSPLAERFAQRLRGTGP